MVSTGFRRGGAGNCEALAALARQLRKFDPPLLEAVPYLDSSPWCLHLSCCARNIRGWQPEVPAPLPFSFLPRGRDVIRDPCVPLAPPPPFFTLVQVRPGPAVEKQEGRGRDRAPPRSR